MNWVNNCGQYMIATGHCRVFSLLFTFLTSICFHPTTTATTPRVPRSSPGEGVGGSKPVRFGQMGKRGGGGGLTTYLDMLWFFHFLESCKGTSSWMWYVQTICHSAETSALQSPWSVAWVDRCSPNLEKYATPDKYLCVTSGCSRRSNVQAGWKTGSEI